MKLRACPLCGNRASAIQPIQGRDRSWNISCGVKDDDSDSCGLVLFGGDRVSREEMTRRWNRRCSEG